MATEADKRPTNMIRRNYMTRTYSGANLLLSSRKGYVEKAIAAQPDNLFWFQPRPIQSPFPPLQQLNPKIEMKLMDIIMGDDLMGEGLLVEHDDKKREELAQKNLNYALWNAGKKRLLLKEKHENAIANAKVEIEKIFTTSNAKFKDFHNGFLEEWKILAQLVAETNTNLLETSLATLSRSDFEELERVNFERLSHIGQVLDDWEKQLLAIEHERCALLSAKLSETSNTLKKLNFILHEQVDQILEEEARKANMLTIDNRIVIKNYLFCLRGICAELEEKTTRFFSIAHSKWTECREELIRKEFTSKILKVFGVDFLGLYTKFQLNFQFCVTESERNLINMFKKRDIQDFDLTVQEWKFECCENEEFLLKEVNQFDTDFNLMVGCMDYEAKKVADFYFPLMEEVNADGLKYMKATLANSRKSAEISDGKLAAVSLQSKAKRNSFVVKKILEFRVCLFINWQRFHEYDLLLIESDVIGSLKDIYANYHSIQVPLRKEVTAELKIIGSETRESVIQRKTKAAKELYKQIFDSIPSFDVDDCEWFQKSLAELESIYEKSAAAYEAYTQKIKRTFSYPEFNSAEANDRANIREIVHELNFWQSKVEEWKVEMNIHRKDMKAKKVVKIKQLSTTNEVEVTDRLLFDGSKLEAYPNPLLTFENFGFNAAEPTRSLLDLTVETKTPVVDIPYFSQEASFSLRTELCKSILEEAESSWQEISLKLRKTIGKHCDSLKEEYLKRQAEYQYNLIRLNESSKARTAMLPRLQASHEHEARYIIESIQQMRTSFTEKMTNVFKEIKDFSSYTIKETNSKLATLQTPQKIENLKAKFTMLVEAYHLNTNELIEKAALQFEHERKSISRSRVQGNHSSAWVLIKESGLYDPATITHVMDEWKLSVSEELSKVMREVNIQIKSTLRDFEFYKQDCELIISTKKIFKRLYAVFKAEKIWCENIFKIFRDTANQLFMLLEDNTSLRPILEALTQLYGIQVEIRKVAHYLDHESKKTIVRYFNLNPAIEDWREWNKLECEPKDFRAALEKVDSRKLTKVNTFRRKEKSSFRSNEDKSTLSFPMISTNNSSAVSIEGPINDLWYARTTDGEKSFKETYTQSIDLCKKLALEEYENYSTNSANREIKMTNDIPPTNSAYVQTIDQKIGAYQVEVEQFRAEKIKEFEEIQKQITLKSRQYLDSVLLHLFNDSKLKLDKVWKESTEVFIAQLKSFRMEKSKCLDKLNGRQLLNCNESSLEELIKQVNRDSETMYVVINTFGKSSREKIQITATKFVSKVQFFTVIMVETFNNLWDPEYPIQGDKLAPKIDLTIYPFEIEHRSKGNRISLDVELKILKDLACYEAFFQSRDHVIKQYGEKVSDLFKAIDYSVMTESNAESEWIQAWNDKLTHLKSIVI